MANQACPIFKINLMWNLKVNIFILKPENFRFDFKGTLRPSIHPSSIILVKKIAQNKSISQLNSDLTVLNIMYNKKKLHY